MLKTEMGAAVVFNNFLFCFGNDVDVLNVGVLKRCSEQSRSPVKRKTNYKSY